ncbi:UNVERIFIED_CONTAM: hypothetical protein FKN15_053660 [Acipenser sinensis]
MKCLREKGQGPRIDQYFLRSQSSQSNEIQRQEANHSSQDISTPVIDVRRTCMDTVSDEPNDPCEPVLYKTTYHELHYAFVIRCSIKAANDAKVKHEEQMSCSTELIPILFLIPAMSKDNACLPSTLINIVCELDVISQLDCPKEHNNIQVVDALSELTK